MTASNRRAWRQTIVVGLAAIVMMATVGGQVPRAAAQNSSIKLPPKVDLSQYSAEYEQIKAAYSSCISQAGSNKSAVKSCNNTAKAALIALVKKIKDDIAKSKGDHAHDHSDTGPPAPPEPETDPLDDAPNAPPSEDPPSTPIEGPRYDYKILVVAADGNEPQLGAIKQTLDYMGTPYDVLVSSQQDLTPGMLFTNQRAHYYAVILTNGEAGYSNGITYQSGLTPEEWATLQSFEASFGIRQVTWYTWPNPAYGLNYPVGEKDTTTSPVAGTLTTAGRQVFSHLTLAPITIRNAWTYLSTPLDSTTTPLITTADGHALASVKKYEDGRENLTVTFDSNEYLVHSHQVSYGLVNWVTKGRFLGQRRVYLDAQVDDIFYPNDLWNVNDPNQMVASYRMSGDDLQKAEDWQRKQQAQAMTKDVRLTMVYNGEGTSGDEEYQPDTLTPKAQAIQSRFKWINHTWTHLNLNDVDYQAAYDELKLNLDLASTLKLTNFSAKNMVTPEISGLFNPAAMKAAYDLGIRYTVGDTSRPELGTPSPNTAVYNQFQPSIMMIPRRPSNLFYNVSTPAEWTSEYNHLYRTFWGRDLTYAEILDKESDVLLQYMMKGEIYPWMFHQANLRFYDGTNSLLTDVLDATLNKYRHMFRSPVLSLRQDVIGARIEERMAYNAADIQVTYNEVPNSLTVKSDETVIVPITGVRYGKTVFNYGGEYTSYVPVTAGKTVTISLN